MSNFNFTIWLSGSWLAFSIIYLYEPGGHFYVQEFTRKFVAMGVLPLAVYWGIYWTVMLFKKRKD